MIQTFQLFSDPERLRVQDGPRDALLVLRERVHGRAVVLRRGREGQDLLLRGERQRVLLAPPQRLPVHPGHGATFKGGGGGDAEPLQGVGQEAAHRLHQAHLGAAQGGA